MSAGRDGSRMPRAPRPGIDPALQPKAALQAAQGWADDSQCRIHSQGEVMAEPAQEYLWAHLHQYMITNQLGPAIATPVVERITGKPM